MTLKELKNLGRFEETLFCYEQALKINPQDERSWHNKSDVLVNLGQLPELP